MKKEFEILIEKSNITPQEAEIRLFKALEILNINDLYLYGEDKTVSKSI